MQIRKGSILLVVKKIQTNYNFLSCKLSNIPPPTHAHKYSFRIFNINCQQCKVHVTITSSTLGVCVYICVYIYIHVRVYVYLMFENICPLICN